MKYLHYSPHPPDPKIQSYVTQVGRTCMQVTIWCMPLSYCLWPKGLYLHTRTFIAIMPLEEGRNAVYLSFRCYFSDIWFWQYSRHNRLVNFLFSWLLNKRYMCIIGIQYFLPQKHAKFCDSGDPEDRAQYLFYLNFIAYLNDTLSRILALMYRFKIVK